jgi:hypothetical protein
MKVIWLFCGKAGFGQGNENRGSRPNESMNHYLHQVNNRHENSGAALKRLRS